MIEINLLSSSDKIDAKWERINCLVILNFLILIIGQVFLLSALLISAEYLKSENGKLNKKLENIQTQTEIREIEQIKNNINEYDNQLKTMLNLQKNHYSFNKILENFSKIIPDKIKVNNIEINPQINKSGKKEKNESDKFYFNISGTFKNRDSLLEFENNLKKSETFTDLIVDLSNYSNEDNNFRYSMTVDMSP